MDDIERRLARVKPASPPADLRDRITSRADSSHRRDWLLPIGAVAAAILLYALAAHERAAAMAETPVDPAREAAIREVTEQLGGGPLASRIAAGVVRAELAKEWGIE